MRSRPWRYAAPWLLPRNPMELIDAPRVAQSESTVWSAPEARRFLDGIADDRLLAMWVLFLTTGMRRGEKGQIGRSPDREFQRQRGQIARRDLGRRKGGQTALLAP